MHRIPGALARPRQKADLIVFCLALALLVVYCRFVQTYAEGWDPLAYLYAAERIAGGSVFSYCHPYNSVIGPYFTMAGFNIRAPNPDCLYLNYPPGYALLLALARRLVPFSSIMLYVPALFGALGVVLTYLLGQLLSNIRVALTAALLVGLTPIYLAFSTSPWSDLPVAVLLLAGLVLMVWADRQLSTGWQIVGAACAAFVISWGVFSRYSAIVYLVPIVVYVVVDRSRSLLYRSAAVWTYAATTAGCLVAIGFFNHTVYGGFLRTPYSPENGWYSWPMFSLGYLLGPTPVGSASLVAVAQTLWQNYGLLLLFGLVGALVIRGRVRALLIPGLVALVVFYGLYAFPARGINSRFIIPMLPFLSLLIALGIWHRGDLNRFWVWVWRASAILVIAAELGVTLPATLGGLDDRNYAAKAYVERMQSIVASTSPDSVFLAYNANDAISYYGRRLTLFYRRIGPPVGTGEDGGIYFESHLVAAVDALLDRGVPVYYVLDANPPFMRSLPILSEHFEVVPSMLDTTIYRVQRLQP